MNNLKETFHTRVKIYWRSFNKSKQYEKKKKHESSRIAKLRARIERHSR